MASNDNPPLKQPDPPCARFVGGTLVLEGVARAITPSTPFQQVNARWRCPAVHYRTMRPWLKGQGIRNRVPRWRALSLSLQDDREPHPYQTQVLQAWLDPDRWGSVVLSTGAGKTFLALHAIAHPSPYLKQLESLRLIERRIPATIPPARRRTSRTSRYHLADPYLRFYFRFIEPNLGLVEQELTGLLWERIGEQFRAFVGLTPFEELCREWTLTRARAGKLPFPPEIVGSHWAPDAQVDVVALNWQEKAILLGECKWGMDALARSVVRELVDKAPRVLPAKDWQVHYAFFARTGFTDAARAEAESVGARLVDLETLDQDLRRTLTALRLSKLVV